MNTLRKLALTVSLMALAVSAQATPISFGITSVTLTPGSGYGVDVGSNPENGGQLLGVVFTNTFSSTTASLSNVNDSFTFTVGTVNFNEPNTGSGSNLGIRNGEDDNLGVTASFTFTNPLGITQLLTAVGTATLGDISDPDVDYKIDWAPVTVSFGPGNSGKFQIDLLDLLFTGNGIKNETATVTLLQLENAAPAANVPEPASVALLGLGLAGLALTRRKRSA